MFQSARLKLTAWYLLAVMAVSLFFSGLIYRLISLEYSRRLNNIERRLQLHYFGTLPPAAQIILVEDFTNARRQLLLVIGYINGGILIVSVLGGYFLAGKTLSPIEKSLEDQKRFIADASHELKTPITALKTSIEVDLRDPRLNLASAKKVLRQNLLAVNRLQQLTADLLTLARCHHQPVYTNIKPIIAYVIRRLSPLAKAKKIKINNHITSISLTADANSLEQLFTILIDNAIKYTPSGGQITLTTQKLSKYLKISVTDTGIGISAKHLPHIFDRFYRADSSRSTPGFGLGLAIAWQIANIHHGSIQVKSQPGKGSTFTVTLPF